MDKKELEISKSALAIPAGLLLAGCSSGIEVDREALAGFNPESLRYSGAFLIPSTRNVSRSDNLEFFWSATCMFSANLYGNQLAQFIRDPKVRQRTNVGFFQLARNEMDARYYAVMRSFREYPDLCYDVLTENARAGKPIQLEAVIRMAKSKGYRRAENYALDAGVKIAKQVTNLVRRDRRVSLTPTLLLDGRQVRLS